MYNLAIMVVCRLRSYSTRSSIVVLLSIVLQMRPMVIGADAIRTQL